MTEVVAGFGCSAQARSYRNKPRPPAMRPFLVNRFPPVTRYALSAWRTHPVPIALGEVSDLAEIEQATGTRNLEGIGFPSRVSSGGSCSADSVSSPRLTEHLPPHGSHTKLVPTFLSNDLRRPAFELLSPSVVIRRRPQRDQIFVSPA